MALADEVQDRETPPGPTTPEPPKGVKQGEAVDPKIEHIKDNATKVAY